MSKKLDMVAQSTKDLQRMCKQLDLTMHLTVSDGKHIITAGCGGSYNIIHLIGDGICDLAEQLDTNVEEILTHIAMYLAGDGNE